MARPKSDIVKGMGAGWEIILALWNEILSLGGNDEHFRRILTSKTLRRQIAELIVGSVKQVSKKLASLADMIALGKYDWVNENITEANFPMPEGFTLGAETKLYHFGHNTSSEEVLREMERDGFRPATIWDLLDYGVKNPELQRQFPIIALGSVAEVDGVSQVACLYRLGTERSLRIDWFDVGWDGSCRFLAVRN